MHRGEIGVDEHPVHGHRRASRRPTPAPKCSATYTHLPVEPSARQGPPAPAARRRVGPTGWCSRSSGSTTRSCATAARRSASIDGSDRQRRWSTHGGGSGVDRAAARDPRLRQIILAIDLKAVARASSLAGASAGRVPLTTRTDAARFVEQGAHRSPVDFDGARTGELRNLEVVGSTLRPSLCRPGRRRGRDCRRDPARRRARSSWPCRSSRSGPTGGVSRRRW
jgi:hypothetical protein